MISAIDCQQNDQLYARFLQISLGDLIGRFSKNWIHFSLKRDPAYIPCHQVDNTPSVPGLWWSQRDKCSGTGLSMQKTHCSSYGDQARDQKVLKKSPRVTYTPLSRKEWLTIILTKGGYIEHSLTLFCWVIAIWWRSN